MARIEPLSLGADPNSFLYRAVAEDDTPYFVKLRSAFDETSVAVPKLLADQGIAEIIPPLETRTGALFAGIGDAVLIVHPFVAGRSGLEVPFLEHHWLALGDAVARIHCTVLPHALDQRLRREAYSPTGRERVKAVVRTNDPALDAFVPNRRSEILQVVERAEQLAESLRAGSPELALCHSDLHAGNVLIDARGALFIVDWDDPILAPRERDLMFAGGAQGYLGHTPEQEEALFLRGYGAVAVDPDALAYYRYERIVQDFAVYAGELLSADTSADRRAEVLRRLEANFPPGGTIDRARSAERG
ncbi:MAG: phosphotransferase [bacterium]